MVLRWALATLRLDSLRGCLYLTHVGTASQAVPQCAASREPGAAHRLQSAGMRKAALLYNPESGGSKRRQRELQSAVELLRSGGVEADLLPTDSKEHAAEEARRAMDAGRSEEHTSELQSRQYLVCRLLLEKKRTYARRDTTSSPGRRRRPQYEQHRQAPDGTGADQWDTPS